MSVISFCRCRDRVGQIGKTFLNAAAEFATGAELRGRAADSLVRHRPPSGVVRPALISLRLATAGAHLVWEIIAYVRFWHLADIDAGAERVHS